LLVQLLKVIEQSKNRPYDKKCIFKYYVIPCSEGKTIFEIKARVAGTVKDVNAAVTGTERVHGKKQMNE